VLWRYTSIRDINLGITLPAGYRNKCCCSMPRKTVAMGNQNPAEAKASPILYVMAE